MRILLPVCSKEKEATTCRHGQTASRIPGEISASADEAESRRVWYTYGTVHVEWHLGLSGHPVVLQAQMREISAPPKLSKQTSFYRHLQLPSPQIQADQAEFRARARGRKREMERERERESNYFITHTITNHACISADAPVSAASH